MAGIDSKKATTTKSISTLVKVTKAVTNRLVNSETEGILKRPTNSAEIVAFNGTVEDILVNKLKKKLGV